LGDHAELDLAEHEGGRDNQNRNELNKPIIAGRKEPDIAVDRRDAPEILDDSLQALSKPCGLALALVSNPNTFGIVANMDERRAEARLAVELVAVQLDERPGELDRQIRAERGAVD
jgi:hypothetical protein